MHIVLCPQCTRVKQELSFIVIVSSRFASLRLTLLTFCFRYTTTTFDTLQSEKVETAAAAIIMRRNERTNDDDDDDDDTRVKIGHVGA